MKPKESNVFIGGLYLTPRLVVQYTLGQINRQALLNAFVEEHITDALDQADIIGYLDSLRPEGTTEADSAICRCNNPGYITADPYMDEIHNEMILDVYCEDCFMNDADEI